MNKRGISHIEVILSFIVFIAVVFFVIYYLPPYKANTNYNSLIEDVDVGIRNYSEMSVEVYGVKTLSLVAPGTKEISMNLSKNITRMKVVGIDTNGAVIEGHVADYENGIVCLNYSQPLPDFFYIELYENQISQSASPCPTLNDSYYLFAGNKQEEVVSYDKLVSLKNEYDSNYSNAKYLLDVPKNNDFGFLIKINETSSINSESRLINSNDSEVHSKTNKINIIMPDGEIKTADLNIKIW